MGIFAERAWITFDMINKDANSLTAYYSKESSWHIVITRQNDCLDGIPLEIKTMRGLNSWSVSTPRERFWDSEKKDFPFYAVYLVPWSTYDDGDGTDGMIKMINNKKDKYMTRISHIGDYYIKIHKFMSDFQYPFLKDIQTIQNVSLFFHQKKFKKLALEREIVAGALHPDRLQYYLSLGYSIEDFCDY